MRSLAAVRESFRRLRHEALPPVRADYRRLRQVRGAASRLRDFSMSSLRQQAEQLVRQSRQGSPDRDEDSLVASLSLTIEAIRRAIGIELFDVQVLAGLALERGAIAEMKTGEGKTLAAALPAVRLALTGRGVHVMTVNAYLAQRDYELLRPVYELMGLSVGVLQCTDSRQEKMAAYASDITYGPGYEFGFDYLRDQVALLARAKPRLGDAYRGLLQGRDLPPFAAVQTARHAAIVDEADSVMLDEATTPLILSSQGGQPVPDTAVYTAAQRVADQLVPGMHYLVDPARSLVHLTAEGASALCQDMKNIPLQALRRPWTVYVQQALRASSTCAAMWTTSSSRAPSCWWISPPEGSSPIGLGVTVCGRRSRPARGWSLRPRTRSWPASVGNDSSGCMRPSAG